MTSAGFEMADDIGARMHAWAGDLFPICRSLTGEGVRETLAYPGVRTGDRLAIHSRLISIGRIEGGVQSVYDAVRAAIGSQGTLVVPTYTLADDTIYDRAESPSQGMGVFSEFVRQREGAVRSACPMHNHAGIGPLSVVLDDPDGSVSIGPGSDFDALHRAGFRLLLLGTGVKESATFIHHIEALASVPYRVWLDLKRAARLDNGETGTKLCRYFGRKDRSLAENCDAFQTNLIASGAMKKVLAPLGARYLVDLGAMLSAGLDALALDPFAFVHMPAGSDAHGA